MPRPAQSATVHLRMRHLALVLLVAVTGLLSPLAHATACPQHYAFGQAPVIVKASLRPRTQEICLRAYAAMHSGLSRTPLWSAEHLVRDRVQAAGDLVRKDSFHAETALPAGDRAELADYVRSGYDRGHMQYPVHCILFDHFASDAV